MIRLIHNIKRRKQMDYIEELTNEYDDIEDIIKVVEGSTRTEPKENEDD
jgi:hypothetical protein